MTATIRQKNLPPRPNRAKLVGSLATIAALTAVAFSRQSAFALQMPTVQTPPSEADAPIVRPLHSSPFSSASTATTPTTTTPSTSPSTPSLTAPLASGNVPQKAASPQTTYSRGELLAELKNVQRSEDALAGVGLKIKISVNAQQKREVAWDSDYMDTYKGDIHTAQAALQVYLRVAGDFVKKYDREFLTDGSTETYRRYARTVLPVLAAKVTLAQQGLELLAK